MALWSRTLWSGTLWSDFVARDFMVEQSDFVVNDFGSRTLCQELYGQWTDLWSGTDFVVKKFVVGQRHSQGLLSRTSTSLSRIPGLSKSWFLRTRSRTLTLDGTSHTICWPATANLKTPSFAFLFFVKWFVWFGNQNNITVSSLCYIFV